MKKRILTKLIALVALLLLAVTAHCSIDSLPPKYPYLIPEGVVLSDEQYINARNQAIELEYLKKDLHLRDSISLQLDAKIDLMNSKVDTLLRQLSMKNVQIDLYKKNEFDMMAALQRQKDRADAMTEELNKRRRKNITQNTLIGIGGGLIIVGLIVAVILK